MNRGREGELKEKVKTVGQHGGFNCLYVLLYRGDTHSHTLTLTQTHISSTQLNFIFIHDQTLVRTLLRPADTRTRLLSLETAGGQ